MSKTYTYSYTHSVTFVADNILKSFKNIILQIGLSPSKFVGNWAVYYSGLTTWLESGHLEIVTLEIFDPRTDELLDRFDFESRYGWSSETGHFWVDTDRIKYELKKVGLAPSQAEYRFVISNKPGRPDVDGWSSTTYRSTEGFVRQSVGSIVEHQGLGASMSYWRKK